MSSTWAGIIFLGTLILALVLVHKPLGDYMARVLTGKRHLRVEKAVYKVGGVDADADQTWGRYLRSVLAFSAVSRCCSCTCSCACSSISGIRTRCRR